MFFLQFLFSLAIVKVKRSRFFLSERINCHNRVFSFINLPPLFMVKKSLEKAMEAICSEKKTHLKLESGKKL